MLLEQFMGDQRVSKCYRNCIGYLFVSYIFGFDNRIFNSLIRGISDEQMYGVRCYIIGIRV